MKATNTFNCSLSPRFRFRTGVPKISGHVPLQHSDRWECTPKISYDKKVEENSKNTSLNDFNNNIHRCMYKYFEMNNNLCSLNVFFPAFANLKCTPSDRQGSPKGTCIQVWEPFV